MEWLKSYAINSKRQGYLMDLVGLQRLVMVYSQQKGLLWNIIAWFYPAILSRTFCDNAVIESSREIERVFYNINIEKG